MCHVCFFKNMHDSHAQTRVLLLLLSYSNATTSIYRFSTTTTTSIYRFSTTTMVWIEVNIVFFLLPAVMRTKLAEVLMTTADLTDLLM